MRNTHYDYLDAVVWDAITTWIQSPRMLMQEIEAWRASRAGAEQAARDRLRLETAERRLGEQVARLIDAYQRGALSVDELKARRERLEAARDAARARIEEIAGDEMDRARLERIGEDIEVLTATLRAGLHNLDFQGRQRLVRLLVERVVVTGDHVAIEHAIPLSGRPCGGCVLRVDVLECPRCKGRMKLIAMVTERESVERYLTNIGELITVPERSPSRGPRYWKSTVLRRKALGDAA
jgi:hypothetical protein